MSTTIVDGVSDLVLFSLLRAAVLKKKKDRLQNAHWNVNRLRKRKKDANSRLNRNYGLEWMDSLKDLAFKKAFRMSRAAFQELLQLLCTVCKVRSDVDGIGNKKQATNSSGSPVNMRTRLAVSLRWLAGGNYWDICGLYGVCPGSFYSERGPLWPTLYALDEALHNEIEFDVSMEACRTAAASFAVFSRGRLNHCVCAVDGTFLFIYDYATFLFINVLFNLFTYKGLLIRTRQPRIKELGGSIDIKTYRNRKGCFGILVLAGCDAKCAFTFFTCRHPGSTNDAWAITESEGGKILMGDSLPVDARSTKRLPEPYYGVGDDAFVNCNTLLSPYGGTHLDM